MLKVWEDPGNSSRRWGVFYKYDSEGRLLWLAKPSAVEIPDNLSDLQQWDDLMHDQSGDYEYIRNNAGRIVVDRYYTSRGTGVDKDTAGALADQLHYQAVKHGEMGAEIKLREFEYYKREINSATTTPQAKRIIYPDASTQTEKQITNYSYTWYSGSHRIKERERTFPSVPVSENGPGGSIDRTRTVRFDKRGNRVWIKGPRGTITHYEYNATGGR
jgi:hypothetical protein